MKYLLILLAFFFLPFLVLIILFAIPFATLYFILALFTEKKPREKEPTSFFDYAIKNAKHFIPRNHENIRKRNSSSTEP